MSGFKDIHVHVHEVNLKGAQSIHTAMCRLELGKERKKEIDPWRGFRKPSQTLPSFFLPSP